MEVAEAFSLITNALSTSNVGRSYLLCGDLKSSCDELVSKLLNYLFPDAKEQIEKRVHPDVAILEPEGKSRTIHADSMREKIISPMEVTSYSGGWKVGVVVSADRMQEVAANIFLKTLEEPPNRSLLLLLSDNPDALLPTILSRTQRIDLLQSDGLLEGDEYNSVAEIFESSISNGVYEKARAGVKLAEILAELKDSVEDEDVPIIRKAFFKTILHFMRNWMVEEKVERYLAFRNIDAVEEAFRQCSRYMPEEPVLCAMIDRITFP